MQVNFLNTLNSIAKTNSSFGAKHFGVDENGTRKSELVINNPCGIHSRPSSNIVKLTLLPKEPQDVYVCSETKGKNNITGSILSLLMMGLAKGEFIVLETNETYPEDIHNVIADCFEAADDDENARIAQTFMINYKDK